MFVATTLVLLAALVTLDLRGLDPAVAKLVVLVPGLALLSLGSAIRTRPFRWTTLDSLLAASALWAILASARAPFPGRLPEAWVQFSVVAGAYWLGRRELPEDRLEHLLGLASAIAAASMILELVASPAWKVNSQGMAAEELVGCMANPNLTASCVLLGLPSAIRLWGWPLAALGIGAVAGSMSRGALAGLAVAALVSFFRARKHRSPGALRALLLRVGVALGLLLGVGLLSGRIHPRQVFTQRTVASRIELWQVLSRAVLERPWTGWGKGRTGVAFRQINARRQTPSLLPDRVEFAHNPFLQAAVEGGLPALILLLACASWIARRLTSVLASRASPVALGLLAVLVAEQVGVGLETPLLGGLVALTLGSLADRSHPSKAPPDAPPEPELRSPLALLLGVSLLAATPLAFRLTRAESLRREIRAQTDEGVARPMEPDLADRYPSPELRYDAAGVLALERDLDGSLARYLVLESGYPEYGSSRENRQSIQAYRSQRQSHPPTAPE